jgi:hypothetical protein
MEVTGNCNPSVTQGGPVNRLLILAALAPGAALLPAAEPLRIALVVDAPEGLPRQAAGEFTAETGRLLSLPGTKIVWRELSSMPGGERFHRIIVLRFKGSCRAGPPGQPLARPLDAPPAGPAGPLGYTHISSGRVLPFVVLDCGRIARAVLRHNLAQHALTPAQALGRALARVAAHEIFHALTESTRHDEDGLAQAALTPEQLLLHGFGFAASSRARLRASLAAAPPATKPASPQVASLALEESQTPATQPR